VIDTVVRPINDHKGCELLRSRRLAIHCTSSETRGQDEQCKEKPVTAGFGGIYFEQGGEFAPED